MQRDTREYLRRRQPQSIADFGPPCLTICRTVGHSRRFSIAAVGSDRIPVSRQLTQGHRLLSPQLWLCGVSRHGEGDNGDVLSAGVRIRKSDVASDIGKWLSLPIIPCPRLRLNRAVRPSCDTECACRCQARVQVLPGHQKTCRRSSADTAAQARRDRSVPR